MDTSNAPDAPDAPDVIVVGAGAAGAVVAARLAQQRLEVLLLESGPASPHPLAAVPGRATEVQQPPFSRVDLTPPQSGLGGRRLPMVAGHGLGGGTTVNSMAWFQGSPLDYDGWAAHGAAGWSWQQMRPYLRSAEDHELGASDRHGSDGPMAVTSTTKLHPMSERFVRAAQAVGMPSCDDLDTALDGVGLVRSTIRDGRRWSVVDGYLTGHAPSLHVRADTDVERLVFHGDRVVGVSTADGRELIARHGVVLAAGSIRTPQLLMLSGIGPKEQLAELGIATVSDLPGVGQNLHDHPLLPVLAPVPDAAQIRGRVYDDAEETYRSLHRGPLAAGGQVVALSRSSTHLDAADLQLVFSVIGSDAGLPPVDGDPVAGFVALLTPTSRGTVRLAGADPRSSPIIDPRYLDTGEDRARLRSGVRRLLEIFGADPIAAVIGAPVGLEERSDDAIDAYVASAVVPYWHLVGTAKMGTSKDSVVDPGTMRVHGVLGLHVVDASVLPTVTRGNTQAPVIAAAERSVPLLRAAWNV